MSPAPVRVLLVDDDEDDFIITRELVAEIGQSRYRLDWIRDYAAALAALSRQEHDVCLLDYRLGEKTGLDLIRQTRRLAGCPPMILFTRRDDQKLDLAAMQAGAADYLVKGQCTARHLDRAMRYAIEHKRAAENLRRERDLISRIMGTSPVGIVVADRTGRITFANYCAEAALGLSKADVEQRLCSVLDWCVADDEGLPLAGRPRPLQQLLANGRPVLDVCHALELAGGRRLVISTNATPLFDAAGKNDGMVVAVEDITGRLALEAQLRQSQKMEVVGQLAAGVAHDINNILTIIQGHTGLLLHSAAPNSPAMKSLQQIDAASDRAASFVRHLLMFSRKQAVTTRILDVNGVMRNLQSMLPHLLGEQIQIQFRCQPDLPLVAADATMTEQIIMNLAVNARDAMPGGGTLAIETSAVDVPIAIARQNPEARAGRFVCLTVRDTGCGMERRVMKRIFEPFFTTKEVGKGTGLGLSTVYGIVRQHLGWIEVESELGLGSTFKVFLPAVEAGEVDAPVPGTAKPAVVGGGTETILVVEDEVSLLKVLCRVLERSYYRVLFATSATEALRVWDEQHGRIDLVLTDVVMPGRMTGNDLVHELKRRQPGLKVIVTSGYSPELIGRDYFHPDASFLPKPYQPQTVAQLVRNTLDRPARAVATAPKKAAPDAKPGRPATGSRPLARPAPAKPKFRPARATT
jgi:PAS domain S-box-containing protein